MKLSLVSFTMAGVLIGCVSDPPQTVRVYTPRFQTIAFDFMERYRVSHDYLFGSGIKDCRYSSNQSRGTLEEGHSVVYRSDYGAFVERDGLPYQWTLGSDTKMHLSRKEGFLIGSASKSLLGGQEYRYWEFQPLCGDWIGAHSYIWQIRKSSSLSIEESIQATKDLLDKHWTTVSHWEPEKSVVRNGNKWAVFYQWNKAIYLADAWEHWHLPIGDGAYYIYAAFAYKSTEPEVAPEQYARARAAFDHIIDSVTIKPLK